MVRPVVAATLNIISTAESSHGVIAWLSRRAAPPRRPHWRFIRSLRRQRSVRGGVDTSRCYLRWMPRFIHYFTESEGAIHETSSPRARCSMALGVVGGVTRQGIARVATSRRLPPTARVRTIAGCVWGGGAGSTAPPTWCRQRVSGLVPKRPVWPLCGQLFLAVGVPRGGSAPLPVVGNFEDASTAAQPGSRVYTRSQGSSGSRPGALRVAWAMRYTVRRSSFVRNRHRREADAMPGGAVL